MTEAAIYRWLKKRRRLETLFSFLAAPIAFILGLGVLSATFWLAYFLMHVGAAGIDSALSIVANKRLRLSHSGALIGAALFMVILFIGYFRMSREELWSWPNRRYVYGASWNAGALGGLIMMLAYPGASSRMLADIFFIGPRLVFGAGKLIASACRNAREVDAGCLSVLTLLLERGRAVTYDEFESLGMTDSLAELRQLDGVVFLEKGVTLRSEFRLELSRLS